jgi:hypothetical protein
MSKSRNHDMHERQLFVAFLPKLIVAMQLKIGNQFTHVFFLPQLGAKLSFQNRWPALFIIMTH